MIFSTARRRLTFTAAVVLVGAACGTKEASDPLRPTTGQGRIRFVNLITDPARNPVNAILEGLPFGVNLAYTGTTPSSLPAPSTANFSPILEGPRTLVLKKTADTTVTVASIPVTIGAGTDYTVFATGGSAGSTVTGFTAGDNNPAVAAGQARIKFINMSPAAGAVDVFVTAEGANLATATPAFANVAVRAPTTGVTLAAGTYSVRTVPAGTAAGARAAAVTSTTAITVASTNGRTVVLADAAAGGTPLRTVVLTDQ
ncbi:MAG TPA: DUF4397 domain-containing protein [Gemmatimonadaceae bacterium]|nr:DUF4397 domain-containing protein [Gemmatimonadaceae bacterium]